MEGQCAPASRHVLNSHTLHRDQEEGYVAAILVPEGTNDVPVGKPVLVIADRLHAERTRAREDASVRLTQNKHLGKITRVREGTSGMFKAKATHKARLSICPPARAPSSCTAARCLSAAPRTCLRSRISSLRAAQRPLPHLPLPLPPLRRLLGLARAILRIRPWSKC